MNEYLYDLTSFPFGEEVNEEEMMYVTANEKLRTNRKNKNQKENIYNEGIYHNFYGTESETTTKRWIHHR